VIRARFLEHLIKNFWVTLRRGSGVLTLGGSHKGGLARLLSLLLLLLLLGLAARATLIGILLSLLLALGVMKDRPYSLLTGGKLGGKV
jgi:hypothetical protein